MLFTPGAIKQNDGKLVSGRTGLSRLQCRRDGGIVGISIVGVVSVVSGVVVGVAVLRPRRDQTEGRKVGAARGEGRALLARARPALVRVERVVEGLLRGDDGARQQQEGGDLEVDGEAAARLRGHINLNFYNYKERSLLIYNLNCTIKVTALN